MSTGGDSRTDAARLKPERWGENPSRERKDKTQQRSYSDIEATIEVTIAGIINLARIRKESGFFIIEKITPAD